MKVEHVMYTDTDILRLTELGDLKTQASFKVADGHKERTLILGY